jgi:DNA-directed RNA polymerase sigma subunit (sigma70/sigma32)
MTEEFNREQGYNYIKHLRDLAYSIASHYEGDEERLRRAALRGLADAVRLFNEEKAKKGSYKFSTYATWFMKESVEKEVGKEKEG